MTTTYTIAVVGMNYVIRRPDGTIHSAYITRASAERALAEIESR